MVLRAREIMTERVVTVRPDAPLARAEKLFREYHFSALPVVDVRGRLVGIVSAIDLLRQRIEPDASAATTVSDVMIEDVLTMGPDANVAILTHRLRAYGELRVMPIVDRGHLVGVVTRGDLLRPKRRAPALVRLVTSVLPGDRFVDDPLAALRRPHREPVDWSSTHTVRDVMTSDDLVTVTASTSIEEAVRLITSRRFTALPVIGEGGVLVGIVSEADLLRDPLDGRREARADTAGGAMTRNVITVTPDTTAVELLHVLVDNGLRVVPVVEDRRLVGVVTRTDLL